MPPNSYDHTRTPRRKNRQIKREFSDGSSPNTSPTAPTPARSTITGRSLATRTSGTSGTSGLTATTIADTYGSRIRSHAPTPSDIAEVPMFTEVRPLRSKFNSQDSNSQDMFTHTSFANMGKRLKAYNDTLALLHELGVQHELQLPELVLVGDQSTGKSSLMSGLAGMNLPRSGGVCTRCVIHIHSSRSVNVSCRVSLRLKYRYQPPNRPIVPRDVTEDNPFPPWVPQHEIVKEFKTIDKLDEVEEVLRWAQIAILNPDKNHEQFVPGSGRRALMEDLAAAAENTTTKFSPNVVALELKGPGFTNLSYYDLPGVFVTSTDENDMHLVNVVKNLTAEYIGHPGAIILWACPMNQDPVNSTTFKLIRRHNAQNRTLGVMTKADLIPEDPEAHTQWLSMLRGERNNMRTGYGYFVTSRQSNKTLEEQNEWENNFFRENSERWPESFSQFVDQTGVERLRKRLSEMLSKAFTDSMPAIKDQVLSRYNSACRDLQALPELPSNIEMEINRSLSLFVSRIKVAMDHPSFGSTFQRSCEQFRNCLHAMKPRVILSDSSDAPSVIDLDESDLESDTPLPPARTPGGRKRAQDLGFNTPSKRARNGGSGPSNLNPNAPSRGDTPRPDFRGPPPPPPGQGPGNLGPFAEFSQPMKNKIGQVRDTIKDFSRPGLPDVVALDVYEHFCTQATEQWDRPMEMMLARSVELVHEIVVGAQEVALAKLKKRLIFDTVSTVMEKFVSDREDEARRWLMRIYRNHTSRLFTLNDEDFKRFQDEELAILQHYRHQVRWKAYKGEGDGGPVRSWAMMSAEERRSDLNTRAGQLTKMGPDPFTREVEVYAYVRGYYRLAAARFADSVCLAVHSDLFPELKKGLEAGRLEEEVIAAMGGEGRQAAYARLMEEDEATAVRREKLKDEVRKFETALRSIRKLRGEVVEGDGERGSEGEGMDVDEEDGI